ncbi:4-hydroxy-3-methylbut-2-enyl diphosphate reductase [Candidatus Galacturonibacter soehngenii]|uniref:4-hydroxy-3-methylbut-2-enyl diphosphate reductase n=1 Tax=Candidatus Galacturonatibacter soehngenii TaxID=2307010 RepID=A0A7V7QMG7_9FIRM|nr:4-hydroxy-3-methylbut-2-enyl diphosphate reductase [Candidatus Galacturonibacter soehngenii]KAB1439428.1 4-hydroxy-3-methylbut-2-enyl diphosphate reductase [Candidatus Galacturonibacter soehngenii]MBA4687292.1 4-hydroxy-3-methylbut-2-enyl diphosphate reductase [Candidatus Galacturonibacter soehngenii]
MKVVLAKTAGFCFGVKRAVETVYEQVGKDNIYTYGPIIHNEEVVKDLEKKGVKVIHTEEELNQITEGTVIIRSHGTAKRIYDILNEKRINYVDATCPFVKKIHKIVKEYGQRGYEIVIIGNDKHPEVEGIKGWCDSKVSVIENIEEANNYSASNNQKVCIVSQTTFNYNKFKDLVEIISKKGYDIIVLNTICNATEERQVEASRVASQVDAMIVIGDKHSSNTQKLFEICKDECENTYYIQTLDDLDTQSLQFFGSVGITAGASTPNNIIEEVHSNVRNEF